MKILKVVCLLAACGLGPAASAQSMFKCVQDGKTSYQADPCPTSAKQDTLKAPPPAASREAASGQAPAPAKPPAGVPLDVAAKIEFMSTYQACADASSMFRGEMAPLYEDWRARNASFVSRIENDRKFLSHLQDLVESKRNGKASMCRPIGLELRGKQQ